MNDMQCVNTTGSHCGWERGRCCEVLERVSGDENGVFAGEPPEHCHYSGGIGESVHRSGNPGSRPVGVFGIITYSFNLYWSYYGFQNNDFEIAQIYPENNVLSSMILM